MDGGIYSARGKCTCGGRFVDTGKSLSCELCGAHCRLVRVKFKQTIKKFTDYDKAKRFLNALRYRSDEDDYDPRDYRASQPLGFANLGGQWLSIRDGDGTRCLRNLRNHIGYGSEYFENRNVKDIGYAELEDFFHHLRRTTNLSGKTLHNVRTTLHSFFKWVEKRERKSGQSYTAPEFPEIRYKMRMRQVLDKDTQGLVLEEVRRISWDINPKIYLGCLWLATYVNVRPGELITILEKDIDRKTGVVYVHQIKERDPAKAKLIHLLDEDLDMVRMFPTALPHLPFFRHERRKGVGDWHRKRTGGQFGKDYLWKFWREACRNLGIEGVPLYPGTRHTTVVALSDEGFSPEEIMEHGTQHATSKAFHRYFHQKVEKRKAVSQAARLGHQKGTVFLDIANRQHSEISNKNGAEGGI